jgi:hypothetical protein
MKPLRAADVIRAVDAAGRAISAALDTRQRPIEPDMLNSAGSVSAEWYVETLWQCLAKRSLLRGVSSLDVEFKQPARPADKQLHFALPRPQENALVMEFHVLRRPTGTAPPERASVARITINRGEHRHRNGVAPEPPRHPYGIEVRTRHLNAAMHVSWYTLVALTMDVARRGAQFADVRIDRADASLLYIVPRFSFLPLADAAVCDNLFVYPDLAITQPWTKGKTSAVARVTIWAVANDVPWPIAESIVTIVRTSVVDLVRRPVDESGNAKRSR